MTSLAALDDAVATHDRHHHFYHYIASHLHISYARELRRSGAIDAAETHVSEALFQDHRNQEALNWENPSAPKYREHIATNAVEALTAYEAAAGLPPCEAMALGAKGEFERAIAAFTKRHHAYHTRASAAHMARAEYYFAQKLWLNAYVDYSKAFDLDKENTQAATLAVEALRQQKLGE